jgi:hypothetical protein
MRDQARASAAALPELRAANATDPANGALRRLARAFYVRMRGLRRISYRSVMTAAALAIMLIAFVTVMGVGWHGRGRWY